MIKKSKREEKVRSFARLRECHFSFLRFVFLVMNQSKKQSTLTDDKQIPVIDNPLPTCHRTEPLAKHIAHDLFISAVKRAREERRQQAQIRSKKKISRATKKKRTMAEIDRLFRERCFRPTSIRKDLFELYEKCSPRIRSFLDLNQIEQFIRTSDIRRNTTNN